jgi:tetratricopeptide (TPR) repeat protein
MLLAQILLSQKRFDEVDGLIAQSLALDTDHGLTIVIRGDLAANRGQYDEAMDHYRRAADVDPYRAGPLVESRYGWLRRMQSQR